MEIKRIESQPTRKGSAEWFTGSVRIQPLFEAAKPARVRGASVTFAPGARVKADRSRKSGRAMSFGLRLTKSTGTAQRPPRQ